METFIAVLHIAVALILISLVLVQDSKSGSLGGAFGGGGGSQSVFGATGATTLAQKMTRWTAVLFAITCILLTVFSNRKSIMDSVAIPPASASDTQTNAVAGTMAVATTVAPAGTAAVAAPSTTTAPVKK